MASFASFSVNRSDVILAPLLSCPFLSLQSEKVSLNLTSFESISIILFSRATRKMYQFPFCDIPTKVPLSDLSESLL